MKGIGDELIGAEGVQLELQMHRSGGSDFRKKRLRKVSVIQIIIRDYNGVMVVDDLADPLPYVTPSKVKPPVVGL